MELELIELLDIVEVFNILILGIMPNAGHTNM
jgi:hypothetical protein